MTVSHEQQTSQSSRKLAELRQAISSATSQQELEASVQKLFGKNTGLCPSEFRTPLPELRNMLLARAENASNQLMQQIEVQAAVKPDRLVKESLRIAVSGLAYTTGFALLAGVLPRGHAAADGKPGVDDDYFRKLTR